MIDELDKLSAGFNDVLKSLKVEQTKLLKELSPKELEKYKRFEKRAKELAKKGDIVGINKLKDNFK